MINIADLDEDLVITSNDLVFLQAHINNVPGYELDDDYVLNLAMRNPNYIIGVSDVNQMALDLTLWSKRTQRSVDHVIGPLLSHQAPIDALLENRGTST